MAKGKKKTSDEAIKQLLESGKTQREISKIFGVSEPYISARMKIIAAAAKKEQEPQLPPLPVNFDDPEELKEWISKLIQTGDNAIKLRALELAFKYVRQPLKTNEYKFITLQDICLCGPVIYHEDGYTEPVKVPGQCRNCKQKIDPPDSGYCDSCKAKFPKETSAHIAFWNGNPCPACNIEERGYPYCLDCERRIKASETKESLNHAEK